MRRQGRLAVFAGICTLGISAVQAETLRIEPTVAIEETLTDNVDLAPSGNARGDLVSEVSPGLNISLNGARVTLNGAVSADALLYKNTGAQNNTVLPEANLTGQVEAIKNFLFVQGTASVSHPLLSPYGAQPQDLASVTTNRYTAESYSLNPYVQGSTSDDVFQYSLRDNNLWSDAHGTSISGVDNTYSNEVTGSVVRKPTPLGWSLEYDRTELEAVSQPTEITATGRLRLTAAVDPQVQVSADVGYQSENYAQSEQSGYAGAIYGVGFGWRPNERTAVNGNWEEQFFGSSYGFSLTHSTALSVWDLSASRSVTSYPQGLLSLPAGNVSALLNQLFQPQYPDPGQRQQFVNQFISDNGLPAVLAGPLTLYAAQFYLQEQQSATVGLIGVRNTVFLTASHVSTSQVPGTLADLTGPLAELTNNTQYIATLTWTHSFTPRVTFAASATGSRVPASAGAPSTNQGYATATLSAPLSPHANMFLGARYQVLHSDPPDSYHEAAIFAGLSYALH